MHEKERKTGPKGPFVSALRRRALKAVESIMSDIRAGSLSTGIDTMIDFLDEKGHTTPVSEFASRFGDPVLGSHVDGHRILFNRAMGVTLDNNPALALIEERMDFHGDGGPSFYGLIQSRMDPVLVVHQGPMSRLVESLGDQDPGAGGREGLFRVLRPIIGWSRLAQEVMIEGSFMVPVDEGMACCEMIQRTNQSGIRRIARLNAFISHEGMREDYEISWRKITRTGSLSKGERFPVASLDDPDLIESLLVMRAEGEAWESRRRHAMRETLMGRDGENFSGNDRDSDPSAF